MIKGQWIYDLTTSYVFLLISSYLNYSIGEDIISTHFETLDNTRTTASVAVYKNARSKLECISWCHTRHECDSISYKDGECRILYGSRDVLSDLVDDGGWKYAYVKRENNVDECLSSPCAYGSCVDGLEEYTCTCDPGYQGDHCEDDINECASAPCNHGNCEDGINEYTCTCYLGYQGYHCELDIDECLSTPCSYGNCVDGVNEYTCVCTADDQYQCLADFELLDGPTYSVADSAFSASSSYTYYDFCTSCCRLSSNRGWAAEHAVTGDWLSVDLGAMRWVTKILTRGTGYPGENEYVTEYKVETSDNGNTWMWVRTDACDVMIFNANTNPTGIVTNDMPRTLVTRHVRLTVVDFNVHATLRWEIKGCPVP